eukprot:1598399-Rhodomonas_salina.4
MGRGVVTYLRPIAAWLTLNLSATVVFNNGSKGDTQARLADPGTSGTLCQRQPGIPGGGGLTSTLQLWNQRLSHQQGKGCGVQVQRALQRRYQGVSERRVDSRTRIVQLVNTASQIGLRCSTNAAEGCVSAAVKDRAH